MLHRLIFVVLVASSSVLAGDRCGPAANGASCVGSGFGSCCSQYDYCGNTDAYCGTGCQSQYGKCGQPVSQHARCGPGFGGQTCRGSHFGNCCSQYSWCGSSDAYCSPPSCQKGYGDCTQGPSSSHSLFQSHSSSTTASPSKSSSSSTAPPSTSSLSSSTRVTSSSSTSSAAPVVTQVIVNPSFETGTGLEAPPWYREGDDELDQSLSGRVTGISHSGLYSYLATSTYTGGYAFSLYQDLTVIPGATYNLTYWAYQSTGPSCIIQVYFDSSNSLPQSAPGMKMYAQSTLNIIVATSNQGEATIQFAVICSGANPDFLIDDVTLTLVS